MKQYQFLLFVSVIMFALWSCSDDSLNPNQKLLLFKTQTGDVENIYSYDNQNRITEINHKYEGGTTFTISLSYSNDGLIDYFIFNNDDFSSKYPYEFDNDSNKYIIKSFNLSGELMGKTIYYHDSLKRTVKVIFYFMDTLNINEYLTKEYLNDGTCVMNSYEKDGTLELSTLTEYDDNIDPRELVSLNPYKLKQNNIINTEITFEKDTLSKYRLSFDAEYFSSFEYNNLGYPTKETRWYKGFNEPEITSFFYISANTRTR